MHTPIRKMAGVAALGMVSIVGLPSVATAHHATRTPPADVVTGCGDVISVAASTVTLNHPVGPCTADGITISANGVTLNLGGQKIFGDGNASELHAGIRIASGVSGVTITDTPGANNLVTGFNAGVMVQGPNNIVRNVNVVGNIGSVLSDYGHGIGIDGTSGNMIDDNTVQGNGPYAGVYLIGNADTNTIEDNTVSENLVPDNTPLQAHGIRLEPTTAGAPDNNVIQRNTVRANGAYGIGVMSGATGPIGNDILANIVEANRSDGIRLFAAPASGAHDCPATGGAHCAGDASGNDISTNSVCGNLGRGIAALGHDNVIHDNDVGKTVTAGASCDPNGVDGNLAVDLYDSHTCPDNDWGTFGTATENQFETKDPTSIYGTCPTPGGGGPVDPAPGSSSFLGGSSSDEARAVAVSADGNSAYVTGQTCPSGSTAFPATTGAYDTTANGGCDAFVAKVNTTSTGGSTLAYSTFLGGSGTDAGNGIAVDSSGNAYVTGQTCASGAVAFPTVGAYDATDNGACDAFVAKLNSTGSSLSYSTFLGGSAADVGNGVATDSSHIYVTGQTCSPATTAFPTTASAYDATLNGCDAFMTKLDTALSGTAQLVYSTLQGGSGGDAGTAIAARSTTGTTTVSAWITGQTCSVGATGAFTATSGAFSTAATTPGECDGFVSKFNPTSSGASSLAYATFLGGDANGDDLNPLDGDGYLLPESPPWQVPTSPPTNVCINVGEVCDPDVPYAGSPRAAAGADSGTGIAVNAAGDAYVTGVTHTDNFPTTATAFQAKRTAGNCGQTRDGRSSTQPWRSGGFQLFYLQKLPCSDAFVTKLNAAGSSLHYSTYLGGSDHDAAKGIAINAAGDAYVTGYTFSGNGIVMSSTSAYDGSCNDPNVTTTGGLDAGCARDPFPTAGGGDSNCGTDTGTPLVRAGDEESPAPLVANGTCNSYTYLESRPETPTATPCKALQTAYCEKHAIYIPDAFFTKLNASGSGLVYSAFLGGGSDDWGAGVGVGTGGATVVGRTLSSTFPTSSGAFDTTYNLTGDAFITRYNG